jgi:F-type H+-transporting ATPase subunit a
VDITDNLSSRLLEELNVETVLTIPVFGGIKIAESVVITWVIMAVMLAIAIWLTWGMKVDHISKKQAAAEAIVKWLQDFVVDITGPKGRPYAEYLATVLVYIGISNTIGLFGMKSPTKDLNVTAALALMSIILIEAAGIRARGVGGWIKSFSQPVEIVTPLNILEILIRPLSLCMRLFGNVLGAFVIMELIKLLVPVGLPVLFSLYFDIFDGLIQAYVFVFLTGLFIKEAIVLTEPE